MVKHPRQLGFKLALKVDFHASDLTVVDAAAAKTRDVVYVAIPGDSGSARLNKRDAIKVGQTGKTLKARWKRTLHIFLEGANIRPNEKNDAINLLKCANSKEVSVWMRKAGKNSSPVCQRNYQEKQFLY